MKADIGIIGAGPAGISAAITAKARNKDVLLFGSGISDKITKAQEIRNYPGLPNISGQNLGEVLANHLESMEIDILEEQVTSIYAMGEYFAIQTSGDMYQVKSVIMATGVVQGKPIPGEKELLGNGLSYCATCDGFLYRDKRVIVIGYNQESVNETKYLAELCSKVYYIPVGNKEVDHPRVETVLCRVEGISRGCVHTSVGDIHGDGIFVLKDAVEPDILVPGIKTEDEHILVNLDMETNIRGCFACGDVVGRPYQYIKAAGQGNVAALSAVAYLDEIGEQP